MQFGIFSVGDITTNPVTGKTVSEYERQKNIVEIAKKAEEVGLDVVAVGSTITHRSSPPPPQPRWPTLRRRRRISFSPPRPR